MVQTPAKPLTLDELAPAINLIVKPQQIARAFIELRCTFGDRSTVPDISVFLWDRIPLKENGGIANIFAIAPDWTIEILSPDQNQTKVTKNILHREFTSGYFDVVVADECHRSIYGIWQRALTYFEAFHIGLTATPAAYIERNTYEFYHCAEQLPDFSYPIQDAFENELHPDLKGKYAEVILDPIVQKVGDGELLTEEEETELRRRLNAPQYYFNWFYEVRNDGYNPDKIVGGGRPETPELNDIPMLLQYWREYKQSGYASAPGIKAGTLLEAGTTEPRCWWADLALVKENDYNLAAGRYKPQVAETVCQDDPAVLIREVLHLEREIAAGLEKLLQEVEA
jgi:Putative restriction endonuclease/Type III restriction enzyme, res subunit